MRRLIFSQVNHQLESRIQEIWRWWRRIWAPRSLVLSPKFWLFITVARADSPSSQHCWIWTRNPAACRPALTYAKEHLNTPLSVDALANAACLGPRQFSRLFKEETGQSPAKAIERLRVESARLMMEAGRFSAEEIARKNGFGNRERMRRSFVRAFGQSPQTIQRAASA
jgi:transcriptional regulator GlxA family with amidase domain